MNWVEILIFILFIGLAVVLILSRYDIKIQMPQSLKKNGKEDHSHSGSEGHAPPAHSSHGHDGQGASKKNGNLIGSVFKWALILLVVGLCALGTYWIIQKAGFRLPWGMSVSDAYASKESKRSRSSLTLPELYVRDELWAGPVSDAWSKVITVPTGMNVEFCEADENLSCKSDESGPAKVPFAFKCRTLRNEMVEWSPELCKHYTGISIRSKSETPVRVAYWFKPYGS